MSEVFDSVTDGPGLGEDGLPLDEVAPRPVRSRQRVLDGRVWDVLRDEVDLGAGGVVTRDWIDHMGAVGVCGLDEQERVLLLRQYRHPVGSWVWELPAGLLDVDEESPERTAQRELAEEADLAAGEWHLLLDWFLSPGGSGEAFRLFVARDLRPLPDADRHVREAEELGMLRTWVPLDTARELVLEGRLHSPSAVVGVLAACAARDAGWASLRPADSPWPTHPRRRP